MDDDAIAESAADSNPDTTSQRSSLEVTPASTSVNPGKGPSGWKSWIGVLLSISIVASLGLLIPSFYDWTGADQSYAPPILTVVFWGVIATNLLLWFVLLFIHFRSKVSTKKSTFQFGIRHWAVGMVIVGILAIGGRFPYREHASLVCLAAAFLLTGYVVLRHASQRSSITILICTMYLPFLWIFRTEPSLSFDGGKLFLLGGLPALIPGLLIAGLFGTHFDEMVWATNVLAALEILVCLGISFLGPKRAIAWGVVVLSISLISSFGLNALFRM